MNKFITLDELNIVLYHESCSDGVTSAFIFKYFCELINNNIDIYPCNFKGNNIDLSLLNNKNVIMVDICTENVEHIKNITNKLFVLDHHKTNLEIMTGKDYCYFDMNKSGCGLALDYCLDNSNVEFIKLVEDRDLFTKKYNNTEYFAIEYYENVIKTKDYNLFKELMIDNELDKSILQKYIDNGLEKCEEKNRQLLLLFNSVKIENIKIINTDKIYKIVKFECPRDLRSDFGNHCMNNLDIDFAVMYYYDKFNNEYWVSLRSIDTKTDTTSVGGKGHRNASGMTLKNHPDEYFITI